MSDVINIFLYDIENLIITLVYTQIENKSIKNLCF